MSGPDRERLAWRIGVGIMLADAQGRIFVAQRIDTPGVAWQMPQGGVDEGENLHAAAFRELEEEIGTARAVVLAESRRWHEYDLPDHLMGRAWGGGYRGQRQRWFLMRFTGQDSDIDLARHHEPEFSAWRWAAVDDLPGLAVPFKRALYAALVEEFGALAQPS